MSEQHLHVGLIQAPFGDPDPQVNIARAEALVSEAAAAGAKLVLVPELFEGPYFPQREDPALFALARPREESLSVQRMRALSAALDLVIPVSYFEREGQAYYNSLAVFDGGELVGHYRKTHIPDGPGYEEKYYFRPGSEPPKVFETRVGAIGIGICWDQWYPEVARSLALDGAEILLYPTAIGSEPSEPDNDTRAPWRRAMVGHAVCNAMPVLAANRVGVEGEIRFYGTSFIADGRGDLQGELDDQESGFLVARFDRAQLREERASWGFFRDRRPALYGALTRT